MKQFKYYAVLTGDIVGSSDLRPAQMASVRSSLLRAVNAAKGWKPGLIKGKLEFFRGDGWQLLVGRAPMALRAGIFLRTSLLADGLADSRVAIGLGAIEESAPRRVSLSTGQAFTLSGQSLDKMTQYSRMTIAVPETVGPLSGWLPVVGHLCDSMMRQWTQRQAEVVRIALNPKMAEYEKVGRTLKPAISKQAVAKALSGSNWHAMREAIHLFEETPWGTILQPSTLKGCLTPDNQKRLSAGRQPKSVA